MSKSKANCPLQRKWMLSKVLRGLTLCGSVAVLTSCVSASKCSSGSLMSNPCLRSHVIEDCRSGCEISEGETGRQSMPSDDHLRQSASGIPELPSREPSASALDLEVPRVCTVRSRHFLLEYSRISPAKIKKLGVEVPSLEEVSNCLSDEDASVVEEAVAYLLSRGVRFHESQIRRMLDSPNERLRSSGFRAMVRSSFPSGSVWSAFASEQSAPLKRRFVRTLSRQSLYAGDPRMLKALIQQLESCGQYEGACVSTAYVAKYLVPPGPTIDDSFMNGPQVAQTWAHWLRRNSYFLTWDGKSWTMDEER